MLLSDDLMNTEKTYDWPQVISKEIFRAYDIRGEYPQYLNEPTVYALGLAIGELIQSQGQKNIVVGRDARLSGPALMAALTTGLLESGCDVHDVGIVPTPLLYFATYYLPYRSGVMLTGSHNPGNYNGLKLVIDGKSLSGDQISMLYDQIQEPIAKALVPGVMHQHDCVDAYFNRISNDVYLPRPLKIVVDCGNGVAGGIAPALYRKLGCEVIELFCEVDGHFPNHHPDPSVDENLQDLIAAVKLHEADCGLAFDGDADRLGVVTSLGEIIRPDRQLILFAKDVLSREPGSTIIYDVKCTKHCDSMIREYGGEPVMMRTGHSLMKAALFDLGASLAGEMSGHIFFKERWYGFDDGIYAGARLLEILASDERESHEVFAELPQSVNTPELKVNIEEARKFTFIDSFIKNTVFSETPVSVSTIDGLRVEFKEGWGLVRASNTTPCLILRFEADTEQALLRIQTMFKDALHKLDVALVVPF
jgi:phosphomannomutase / phosphoglucomutase